MYKLYEEIDVPLTDSQKKKGLTEPLSYKVMHMQNVISKEDANAWIDRKSERRSWVYIKKEEV